MIEIISLGTFLCALAVSHIVNEIEINDTDC